ncbi:MAG: hypothetical protein MJ161_06920 [Clostridia bacterium]|nr:hypothetical protein [Clostridia bacterium]
MDYDYNMQVFPAATENVTAWYRQREMAKEKFLLDELKVLDKACPHPLRWYRKNGRFYFWEWNGKTQKGITSNRDRIYTLARHDYLSLKYDALRDTNEALWCKRLKELLDSFLEIGLDIHRIIFTSEQYKWASKPQSQNKKRREDLIYETNGGVLMRSKSEQFIGNMLEELCIPYRYEPEMIFDHRVFHPDFVIMTIDGRLIILEHLGRMDLDIYIKSNIERLRAYNAEDMLVGRDVFLSFEADTRKRERVIRIIDRILAS